VILCESALTLADGRRVNFKEDEEVRFTSLSASDLSVTDGQNMIRSHLTAEGAQPNNPIMRGLRLDMVDVFSSIRSIVRRDRVDAIRMRDALYGWSNNFKFTHSDRQVPPGVVIMPFVETEMMTEMMTFIGQLATARQFVIAQHVHAIAAAPPANANVAQPANQQNLRMGFAMVLLAAVMVIAASVVAAIKLQTNFS
jgi:hypothetical protein